MVEVKISLPLYLYPEPTEYYHFKIMPNDFDFEEWYTNNLLHFAAKEGDLAKAKELLSQGYQINQFDEICHTPLHYAVDKENLEMIRYLIDVGADVNARDEEHIGNTPLSEYADQCSFEVAKLLIDAGADPTIPGWMGLTALQRAEKRKKPEGIKVYELLQSAAKRIKHD